MKYLLTGATGFLGSRLLEALVADGHHLVVLKRSSSNTARINKWLEDIDSYDVDMGDIDLTFENHAPFDAVIHTATCYGRNGEACSQLVESNLLFPLRLLERTNGGGATLFVNTDTSLPAELNAYALSKKQFAAWGRRSADEGQVKWINMVLEHFYGPGDDAGKLVTWLVHSCLNNVAKIPLTMGEQKRDFVHIDDVVRAYQLVLADKHCPTSIEYAVGSGQSVKIRDVAEMICRLCNSSTHLKFGAVPYRLNEVMDSCADIVGLNRLGWSPAVPLEDGMKRLVISERGQFST